MLSDRAFRRAEVTLPCFLQAAVMLKLPRPCGASNLYSLTLTSSLLRCFLKLMAMFLCFVSVFFCTYGVKICRCDASQSRYGNIYAQLLHCQNLRRLQWRHPTDSTNSTSKRVQWDFFTRLYFRQIFTILILYCLHKYSSLLQLFTIWKIIINDHPPHGGIKYYLPPAPQRFPILFIWSKLRTWCLQKNTPKSLDRNKSLSCTYYYINIY